ncbi:MAG: 50S ribosomal protein L31 [Deltaproteobacteria bacterium]|nr:50S ribosomal protein L31 [Deltaproteobacteria bacterium]
MKPEIHPDNLEITINCACGAAYETRSTRSQYNTDICSACHPFYTGKSRIMDREGRVERFRNRYKRK